MLERPHHTIDGHEVHVWHLLTDQVLNHPLISAFDRLLAPAEQARMERIRKERDRVLYALSRVVMRVVLASYLDCESSDVCFSANPFGKPIVHLDRPTPPLRFNLTHSRGAIALAITREREVGVDVEERQRQVEFMALAERFFAASEARYLNGLRDERQRAAFFAIWTLKEAYVKGIGRGLSFPLDAFCFDMETDRLIGFRPLADFVACDWHFQQFELSDRHCGAVAVHNPAGEQLMIQMRDWGEVFLSEARTP